MYSFPDNLRNPSCEEDNVKSEGIRKLITTRKGLIQDNLSRDDLRETIEVSWLTKPWCNSENDSYIYVAYYYW